MTTNDIVEWARKNNVTLHYHQQSQYPHIDMSSDDYERMKSMLEEVPLYLRQFGAVGSFWHTPIFVDRCPDIITLPHSDWQRNLDGEVIDAEIVEE